MTLGEVNEATYGPMPLRKNPPPPLALAAMQSVATTTEVKPNVTVSHDGVLMEFTQDIEFLLMTPRAARLLAAKLISAAEELERGGTRTVRGGPAKPV